MTSRMESILGTEHWDIELWGHTNGKVSYRGQGGAAVGDLLANAPCRPGTWRCRLNSDILLDSFTL